MVAEELGFIGGMQRCAIWLEDLEDGGKAVNVVQPLRLSSEGRHDGTAGVIGNTHRP